MKRLTEYGYLPADAGLKWEQVSGSDVRLIVGTNNADTKGIIWDCLNGREAELIRALKAVVKMQRAKHTDLYVSEGKEEVYKRYETLLAGEDRITLCRGMIHESDYDEPVVMHHPETVLAAHEGEKRGKVPGKKWITHGDMHANVDNTISFTDALQQLGIRREEITGVLYGGIAGRYIPEEQLSDQIGVWGSGEILPVYESDCLAAAALAAMDHMYESTCGRCTFCREGSYQMQAVLRDMVRGKGKPHDREQMEELVSMIPEQAQCSIGKCSVGIMEYLLEEKEVLYQHLDKKHCSSDVCFQEGLRMAIRGDRCIGCGRCSEVCPQGCIEGRPRFIYMIDEFSCDKCMECAGCEQKAVIRIPDEMEVGPDKLTRVGRYGKTFRKGAR